MEKSLSFKFIGHFAFGGGLYFVAKRVELRGDLAPMMPSGISSERLFYHCFAFLLMACALFLFVRALLSILSSIRARATQYDASPQGGGSPPTIDYPEPTIFDPDQVIERYLKEKIGGTGARTDVVRTKPSGSFGRKL
jgi:hypothetical protein